MALTLLAQAALPLKYWWDACVSTVFLINRLLTPVLNNISPFQKLFLTKPDYYFLKVFGCACYPYLGPYNSHKLQFRSSKCVFLGYNPMHKRYKCLSSSSRIYNAHSVNFDESDFPYKSLFLSQDSSNVPIYAPSPPSFSVFPYSTPNVQPLTSPESLQHNSSPDLAPLVTFDPIPIVNLEPVPFIDPNLPSPYTSSLPASIISPEYSYPNPHVKLAPSIPCTQLVHPMVIRSKARIFKPKQNFNADLSCRISVTPTNMQKALKSAHWKQAMDAKFQALTKNNTWTLVPYQPDMHIVSNKWVFQTKYKADGSLDKYKAWLVAKGFQQTPGIDFFETFSPVIKPSTIQVVFTLAMSFGWDIKQIDINNAFLNGDL